MRVRAALESHLASRDVGRVIYGAIIGLALVVAIEPHPPSATRVAAGIAATALSIGLAELYSEFLAAEARTRQRVPREEVRRFLRDGAAVLVGAAFPAVFFVLAALGAMEVETAFGWAKWTGVGLIGGYGFLAARLAGAPLPRAGAHAIAVAALGGFVVLVKALVH